MLVQAAANEWKVPASECTAANSVITHTPSGKTTTYGKVVEAAAKLEPPADVKLKDPKDWKIAGKGVKRLDTVDKTTGAMIYGVDVKLPGMLNAAIKDCPVFGGKLKSYDEAKVMGMKGVKKVVRVNDSAVAVVADTWWHAKTALDALPIVWDEGENAKVSSESIAKWLAEGLDNAQPAYRRQPERRRQGRDRQRRQEGRGGLQLSLPEPRHHGADERHGALYPDKCEVWCGTQNGEAAFAATLEASGLPAEKCDVHKQMLGGGFGRRGMTDYVRQAVAIAKQMPGTPVKLLWSREEDMAHGKYHPVTQCKLTGAFDADNNLTALHIRLSGQSILFTVRPAALENGKDPAAFQGLSPSGDAAIGYTRAEPADRAFDAQSARSARLLARRQRQSRTRSIWNASWMSWRMSVGQDPVEFRRKLMSKHPKHLAVLNAVAEKIGWGKPAPQGVYRGIAQVMGYGSYVAGAAEISVTDGNKIKVHRIVASTDPGYVVNPAQVERQIAGSFVYGLSAPVLRRLHGEGRHDRADQLRHLQLDAHRRDAEGGMRDGAERRLLGRRRRADHRRRRARGAQRLLRGDRQTHPFGAAEGPEHHLCLTTAGGGLTSGPPLPHREIS